MPTNCAGISCTGCMLRSGVTHDDAEPRTERRGANEGKAAREPTVICFSCVGLHPLAVESDHCIKTPTPLLEYLRRIAFADTVLQKSTVFVFLVAKAVTPVIPLPIGVVPKAVATAFISVKSEEGGIILER